MDIDLLAFSESARFDLPSLQSALGKETDWRSYGARCKKVCESLLVIATADLVLYGDEDACASVLSDCADTWCQYLVKSRTRFDREPVLLYNTPLDAAVICQTKDRLSAIKAAMPQVHQPEEEYQTQFYLCWIKILLATDDFAKPSAALLEYIVALENHHTVPHDLWLAKALLGLDDLGEKEFWDAFDSVWYEYDQWVEEKLADGLSITPDRFASRRFIWFEGLAWLSLALRRGFVRPFTGIQYCPDEALGKTFDG